MTKKVKKLSDKRMQCHTKGCRRRSKGPRFHYLCDKHIDVHREALRQIRKHKIAVAKKAK